MRPSLLVIAATAVTLCPLFAASAYAQPAATDRPSRSLAELACAPRALTGDFRHAPRIVGGLDSPMRRMLAPGERLVVAVDADHPVSPGQAYLVRRFRKPIVVTDRPATLDTTGWVAIEQVHGALATARVVWACDGVTEGDVLEPFALASAPAMSAAGRPIFDATGSVLSGVDSRVTGGTGDRMLVDPAAAGPLVAGQRVTFFRRPYATGTAPGPIALVGEGHVLEVGATTAVVRIEQAVLPVAIGDRVAAHR
jgi:hypothetical protein